jgi:hypothetical protein
MAITQKLAEILGDVDRPGDFFASGRAEILAPRLEVEGVGPIALPLLPAQAKQLIKVASRAPYGRGADTSTRRSAAHGRSKRAASASVASTGPRLLMALLSAPPKGWASPSQ